MLVLGKGIIRSIDEGSPAMEAGLMPGDAIIEADGNPLRDIIDWRWHACMDEVDVTYIDSQGETHSCFLQRDEGQDWGIEFDDIIFDKPKVCRNRCTFCFMNQLPQEARASLKLRDDDYRLSFLQGNFVTFTNVDDADVERIIQQRISPLRFSLHAISPSLREEMIGTHAARGIDVAETLLEAGIELHAQIVLMPHVNDGEELQKTLSWAWEHPGVLNVAIVPLGFTSHQDQFTESFQDVAAARNVLETVEPFQVKALQQRGEGWVYPSDEFYRNAYPDNLLEMLPNTEFYGDFSMFEDGIGIVRSYIDDWNECVSSQQELASALTQLGKTVVLVCGCAQKEFLTPLLATSPLQGLLQPLYVPNDYFGGNVDVTGLLCGCDIARAVKDLPDSDDKSLVCVPEVILNADNVTLDDMTISKMSNLAGRTIHVVSNEASVFLPQMKALVENGGRACPNIS